MNYFRGEYWIEDGNVDFADGNVGDKGHELIAMEAAAYELASLCGVDWDSESGKSLEDILMAAAKEEVLDKEFWPEDVYEAVRILLEANGESDDSQELVSVAFGRVGYDPREWVISHLGWIWCRGDWFSVNVWNAETRVKLRRGIHSILDEEGFYNDSQKYNSDGKDEDGDDNPLDHPLTIQAQTGAEYYVTLRELENDESGGRADRPAGPNAQLHDIDVKGQPEHYGTNLGDSRAARILNQLLEASGSALVYEAQILHGHPGSWKRSVNLYHITWSKNVPSIMSRGLIPNYAPNEWRVNAATKRSKGTIFLCTKQRMEYWNMTYNEGWVTVPEPGAKLTWLKIRLPQSWVTPDHATGENYGGDFRCARTIPPDNIELLR